MRPGLKLEVAFFGVRALVQQNIPQLIGRFLGWFRARPEAYP